LPYSILSIIACSKSRLMLSTPEKFNTWLNMALVKSTFLEKLGGVVVVRSTQ
jgi:hypothetical protein